MLEKNELRKIMKQFKNTLSEDIKNQQAKSVFRKIEQLNEFKNADNILLYWSLPDEMPTQEFIRKWNGKKHIFLPTVEGNELKIRKFISEEQLKAGEFNISEPADSEEYTAQIDLAIVPGMAFDRFGNRLGRGKGFYDRFLALADVKFRIGICFNEQLQEKIPTERNDIKMDAVICDKISIIN